MFALCASESSPQASQDGSGEVRDLCARDISEAHRFLNEAGLYTLSRRLLDKSLSVYLCLALLDWTVVVAATYCAFAVRPALAIFAILIIGNRQRALGNLLHDFAHGGFSAHAKRAADFLGTIFLTLPMFTTLKAYRKTHFAHHWFSGSPQADPDYIIDESLACESRHTVFLRYILDRRIWLGNAFGQWRSLTAAERARVAGWWLSVLSVLAVFVSPQFSIFFASIWTISRFTSFHVITTFREMADHVGMQPGALMSYTRNSPLIGFWRPIIHPHNNGLHLAHHLFPRAPFYSLPALHQLLMIWPKYAGSEHCLGYFGPSVDNGSHALYVFDSFTSPYVDSNAKIGAKGAQVLY
jgi:fatty acid desaturase